MAHSSMITIQDLASHCGVEEAWLEREVESTCFHDISKYLSEWKLIAPKLSITQADVEAIESDNRRAEQQRVGFLRTWKQKMSMRATYKALIDSLLSIQRVDDGRGVCLSLKMTMPVAQRCVSIGTALPATALATSPATPPLTTSLSATPPTTSLPATPLTTSLSATPLTTSLSATPPTTSLPATPPTTSLPATPLTTSLSATPLTTSLPATPLTTSLSATPLTTSLSATPPTTSLPATPLTTSLSAASQSRSLEATIIGLVKRFDDLVNSIEESFYTRRIPVGKILRSIKLIPLTLKRLLGDSFHDHVSKIFKAEKIEELFFHLSCYWDYLNPGLLNFLVEKFGSQSDRDSMTAYCNELKRFKSNVKIFEFLKASHSEVSTHILYQYEELSISMDREWEEKTLADAEQFKIKLCNRCHLPQPFLTPSHVHRSSIIITLYLPLEMEVGLDELKPFFKENKVIKVHKDGICVIDWTKSGISQKRENEKEINIEQGALLCAISGVGVGEAVTASASADRRTREKRKAEKSKIIPGAVLGALSGVGVSGVGVGGGVGAGVGAAIGGVMGSIVPGPGTLVGAAVGATIGGIAGALGLGGAGLATGAGVTGAANSANSDTSTSSLPTHNPHATHEF